MRLMWRAIEGIWIPIDGFHLVVQWVLMKVRQKCFKTLSRFSRFSFNVLNQGQADVFHFYIIADAADLDEESLEVNRDLFLHAFGELAAVVQLACRSPNRLANVRVEITLYILISQ
jgi:hypothetical protein